MTESGKKIVFTYRDASGDDLSQDFLKISNFSQSNKTKQNIHTLK